MGGLRGSVALREIKLWINKINFKMATRDLKEYFNEVSFFGNAVEVISCSHTHSATILPRLPRSTR